MEQDMKQSDANVFQGLENSLLGSQRMLTQTFPITEALSQLRHDGTTFTKKFKSSVAQLKINRDIPDQSQSVSRPNELQHDVRRDRRRRRRRRLKGIHSRSDTNRTGAEGLTFYYPRLLYCLDQMLAVMSLSQHRVSSSKTVRPRAPCGARCIGHAVSTWSAVCSEAPHSKLGEGARPHLCMDEWNRPTPVRRRLSLTQAARGKPIPTGLAQVSGTKARSLETFSQYSVFHL